MTNGEKLKETFPCETKEEPYRFGESVFYEGLDFLKLFQKSWWNAEYKEPTIKNDLEVDFISRADVLQILLDYDYANENALVLKDIKALPSVTLQESIHGKCNQCKYYEGVHNIQGHAPCSYHKIGCVMWNWYCSQFESEVENDKS